MEAEALPADPDDREASPVPAEAVLMLRPAHFGFNPQTSPSNRFQRLDETLTDTARADALAEFDGLAGALAAAGIEVHVVEDRTDVPCPDAVFPNNWLSLHADGTVVLYPMLAPSRRLERRYDVIEALVRDGRRVTRLVDLTHFEAQGEFLEGTGSLVFDHAARIAYACLSPRTARAPLEDACEELGYAPCTFTANDPSGAPIYHTNVMLAIGTRVAVVAADAIVPGDRERVLGSLAATGRRLETIDARQVAGFAGNVLELREARGETVLVMSAQAAAAFGAAALDRLRGDVGRIVAAPVPTIETLGGGSVRCMLAEVFLPR